MFRVDILDLLQGLRAVKLSKLMSTGNENLELVTAPSENHNQEWSRRKKLWVFR